MDRRPTIGQAPACSHPIRWDVLAGLTRRYGRKATSVHIPTGSVRFSFTPAGEALLTLSTEDREANRMATKLARKLGRLRGV